MASNIVVLLLALTATVAVAQQYDVNYDYDEAPQHVERAQPQPRSYSRPAAPQQTLRTTGPVVTKAPPIAILKQINRHNDDGSYTYGYEGADGSFKIETKLATGEVMGKYGYVDDTGKTRTIEYGANKYGFQPSGEGITVAPPTLVDETRLAKADRPLDYDDGQYYPELDQAPIRQTAAKAPRPKRPKVQPQQQQYFENSYQEQRPQHFQPQPAPQQQQYQPQPQQQYQPQPQPQQYQPAPQQYQPRPVPPPARASHSQGPEPPRIQIAGAAPSPSNTGAYRAPPPSQRAYSAPVHQQRPFPAQPAPVHQQPIQYQPQRPIQQARSSGGFFDQLTQDYALPKGGASQPLHDISFGINY